MNLVYAPAISLSSVWQVMRMYRMDPAWDSAASNSERSSIQRSSSWAVLTGLCSSCSYKPVTVPASVRSTPGGTKLRFWYGGRSVRSALAKDWLDISSFSSIFRVQLKEISMRFCIVCGKQPHSGMKYKRRGMEKKKGGAGSKVVGK